MLVKFIKGFIIGSSMLVPGASGGTMAIILGVYDELIHAVSSFRENMKTNGLLLLQYGLAGILGVLLLSGPMLEAVTRWEKPVMFLFLGAILGSIPPLYKKATVFKMKKINIFVLLGGLSIAWMVTLFPEGLLTFQAGFNVASVLILLAAGVFIAVALVLPGISASYILLMAGIYDVTLQAIKTLNFVYLTPIAVGVAAGTFLTAGLLEREMTRHPQPTYMLIIGFMLGSLVEVFPGLPDSSSAIICIFTFLSGFGLILWIGSRGGKVTK